MHHPWLIVAGIVLVVVILVIVHIVRFLGEHAREQSESTPKRWNSLR
jgi:hypothetical protein